MAELPPLTLEDALPNPEKSAIISIDVINGFHYEGHLANPRVAAIDVLCGMINAVKIMFAERESRNHNIRLGFLRK